MQAPLTFILRHRRENLRKCSLRGLERREDLQFYVYPKDLLPPLHHTVLLTLDAPILSPSDACCNLLLIDGTWRHAKTMYEQLPKPHLFSPRSLPPEWRTAYPRRQEDCEDPTRGLASVEALYIAYLLLDRNPKGILDYYHWKEAFFEINASLLKRFPIYPHL